MRGWGAPSPAGRSSRRRPAAAATSSASTWKPRASCSWKTAAEEGWAFEGAPVADAAGVYVAMRRNDIRPQAHVACFDSQSGRLRWRRFVCGAETPARGIFHQCTHNLLTLHGETLYYNTNLGAVAALSTEQGRLHWVSLYPRARHGDLLAAGAALAARPDAVPLLQRHAAGGPGRQPAGLCPGRRAPARCSGEPSWKT